jgi:hypothetical protein
MEDMKKKVEDKVDFRAGLKETKIDKFAIEETKDETKPEWAENKAA